MHNTSCHLSHAFCLGGRLHLSASISAIPSLSSTQVALTPCQEDAPWLGLELTCGLFQPEEELFGSERLVWKRVPFRLKCPQVLLLCSPFSTLALTRHSTFDAHALSNALCCQTICLRHRIRIPEHGRNSQLDGVLFVLLKGQDLHVKLRHLLARVV